MNITEKAHDLVSQMTLEEKVSLLSGQDCWTTKPVPRLDLPSIMVSDGPHGLRKQVAVQDNFGVGESIKATCFPTASLTACSFDEDLLYEMGQALASECIKEDVSVILGPGINMKRSPLCGRNFEYFSEDPLLAGKLSAAFIKGVQSKGVGTSLKHLAVNSQEKRRMSISAVVDDRTLNEYYLKAFEIAVTEAKPWTVMCSYNKINDTYSSENKELLTDILRTKWGFDGLTVSDWGAVHIRKDGVKAGLNLEMPGNKGMNNKKVLKAVQDGELNEAEVDACAQKVVELVLRSCEEKEKHTSIDQKACSKENILESNHSLAVKIAESSMVLLKNDDKVLPFKKGRPDSDVAPRVLLIGDFAKNPRFQGAGSSRINPVKVDSSYESFSQSGWNVTFAKGYELDGNENQELIDEAVKKAKTHQNVIIFAGLPSSSETEGMDRTHMKMPENQSLLISEILNVNPEAVVVLMGGSPFELPWISKAKTVLLAYLGGEGLGKAIFNLITGVSNPSGKLAETWPTSLDDCLSTKYFPGDCKNVQYRESIFTGYRYFDTVNKKVNFSFGHGLSYTTFEYSNFKLCEDAEINITQGIPFTLSADIKNTGDIDGSETAFIFASFPDSGVYSARKNLSAFKKIFLKAGETKAVTFTVNPRELSFYDAETGEWKLHQGPLVLTCGGSLEKARLDTVLFLNSAGNKNTDHRTVYDQIASGVDATSISDEDFASILGRQPPKPVTTIKKPFTMDNCLLDAENTWLGKIIKKFAYRYMEKVSETEKDQAQMMVAAAMEMPFFGLPPASGGMVSEGLMKFFVKLLNL